MLGPVAIPPRLLARTLDELHDFDHTAESLEGSMSQLQAMLKRLPGI